MVMADDWHDWRDGAFQSSLRLGGILMCTVLGCSEKRLPRSSSEFPVQDPKSLLSRLLCDDGEKQRDAEVQFVCCGGFVVFASFQASLTRKCLWQGFIFVDRDPKHFGVILNYLRDGFAVLPRDEQALREIMVEAAYYKVGVSKTGRTTCCEYLHGIEWFTQITTSTPCCRHLCLHHFDAFGDLIPLVQ